MLELNKGSRQILTPKHKDFLARVITFSWHLTQEIQNKYLFFNNSAVKISSSLILGEILYRSEWGEHPLAKERFPNDKTGKWSNNLVLLESDAVWTSKFIEYKGKKYKSFKDWGSFGTHFTDLICFNQNTSYSFESLSTRCYDSNIQNLIENYDLKEFEFWLEQDRLIKLN